METCHEKSHLSQIMDSIGPIRNGNPSLIGSGKGPDSIGPIRNGNPQLNFHSFHLPLIQSDRYGMETKPPGPPPRCEPDSIGPIRNGNAPPAFYPVGFLRFNRTDTEWKPKFARACARSRDSIGPIRNGNPSRFFIHWGSSDSIGPIRNGNPPALSSPSRFRFNRPYEWKPTLGHIVPTSDSIGLIRMKLSLGSRQTSRFNHRYGMETISHVWFGVPSPIQSDRYGMET